MSTIFYCILYPQKNALWFIYFDPIMQTLLNFCHSKNIKFHDDTNLRTSSNPVDSAPQRSAPLRRLLTPTHRGGKIQAIKEEKLYISVARYDHSNIH